MIYTKLDSFYKFRTSAKSGAFPKLAGKIREVTIDSKLQNHMTAVCKQLITLLAYSINDIHVLHKASAHKILSFKQDGIFSLIFIGRVVFCVLQLKSVYRKLGDWFCIKDSFKVTIFSFNSVGIRIRIGTQ